MRICCTPLLLLLLLMPILVPTLTTSGRRLGLQVCPGGSHLAARLLTLLLLLQKLRR
jgi:hypothetical protein